MKVEIPAEVTALAVQAGGSIVAAMTVSGWNKIKRKFARSIGVGDAGEEERIVDRLERDKERLGSVDPAARSSLERVIAEKWADCAVEAIIRNPDRAAELTVLLSELRRGGEVGQAQAQVVTQIARADGSSSQVNQVGGSQYIFGTGFNR
ncbi:hypothetical protein [Micromonospora qiuiae]|nr:hypothetical protein [Micromonospora qiuiae]